MPKEEKTFIPNLDKLNTCHIVSVVLFSYGPFITQREKKKIITLKPICFDFVIACLYGVATELMQKYLIPNRDYDYLISWLIRSALYWDFYLLLLTV